MKKNSFNIPRSYFSKIFFLSVFIISLGSCNDPVDAWKIDSKYMVMTEYIQENSDYSEFGSMLEYTGLYSLLSTRGPFTLFLPTNDAMNTMYAEMGVSSYTEIEDSDFVDDFIYNHIIGTSILTAEIGLGALRETNVLGDYIVTDYVGNDIRLNKEAIITKRNEQLSNGYIHVIDKTIPILKKSVYQTLKDLPAYSLFVKGLELTGLSDTLDIIEFDFGDLVARNRYTVFAVDDQTFNRYGITTPDELVNYFTDDPSTITSGNNTFYQYMVYHCMQGSYYLSNLVTGTYPVISSENYISVTITDDYKLNMNPMDREEYTGFNISESNYPTKNGALHTLNDLFEAPEPTPIPVLWNVFDHLEITEGDWYLNYFKKWDDTKDENGKSIYFKNIVFQGDYLQYYWKGNSNPGWIKGDRTDGYAGNRGALNMMGYWWIELTTPRIMKGKYEIRMALSVTGNNYSVYVDGEKAQIIDYNRPASIGEHEFKVTGAHTIKLVSLDHTTLFWRDIQFIPVD